MKKIFLGILICLLAAGSLYIYSENNPTQLNRADDKNATAEGIGALVRANNQFALDMYAELVAENDSKNIFFSPYSISTALAMTYEGARGTTADEMRSVFYFPESQTEHRAASAAIYNKLNAPRSNYTLRTANALWVREDFPLLDTYTDVVSNYYRGNVVNLDFINETEASRQTINAWVADQTENRIKDLLEKGIIDAGTALVLTNAVYFKGDWELQFDERLTTDEEFWVSPEETVQVPMMRLTGEESQFRYTEVDGIQVLELPYQGDDLSMLVILPPESGLRELQRELTVEQLSAWRTALAVQQVDVFLPRFTFEDKLDLKEQLSALGMPTAFGGADFSGMTDAGSLFISKVIHQAFIKVNEEGSEAAAATAVIMNEVAAPITKVFRADQPFIFAIQENETGAILFMGTVNNPVK